MNDAYKTYLLAYAFRSSGGLLEPSTGDSEADAAAMALAAWHVKDGALPMARAKFDAKLRGMLGLCEDGTMSESVAASGCDPTEGGHAVTAEGKATIEKTAQAAYAAYNASSGGKNYQGLPCPRWPDLTEAVRTHWQLVAECFLAAGAAGGMDALIFAFARCMPSADAHAVFDEYLANGRLVPEDES